MRLKSLLIALLINLIDANRVLELNENFSQVLKQNPHQAWLVKFYAPWCHHCRKFGKLTFNVKNAAENYHLFFDLSLFRTLLHADCTTNS